MTYQTEFPDFDPATMPVIPEGFQDVSWHNDACPCFASDTVGACIWVDFSDASLREYPQGVRFSLTGFADGCHTEEEITSTDSWQDILAAIEARKA